jgi:hypothetical protein
MNGRVIPIKRRDAAGGVGVIAAGSALAAGGGRVYRKIVEGAVKFANKASFFTPSHSAGLGAKITATVGDYQRAKQASSTSMKLMNAALKLERASTAVRIGSKVAGAGLISYGAAKLAGSLAKQKDKDKAYMLGGSAGTVASTAFAFGFKPSLVTEPIKNRMSRNLFNHSSGWIKRLFKAI